MPESTIGHVTEAGLLAGLAAAIRAYDRICRERHARAREAFAAHGAGDRAAYEAARGLHRELGWSQASAWRAAYSAWSCLADAPESVRVGGTIYLPARDRPAVVDLGKTLSVTEDR